MTASNEATIRQIEAADPSRSTWLSANAGSGKTRVLTDRVARLLLDGVSPQNILCLTYTKAAASEMQNRLFKRLGEWAMRDNGPLASDLRDLGVERSMNPDELAHARTLFAKAIETPGGLKIQTIHSFCAAILRRFPLEAGVSPTFTEMEERDAQLLRMEVLDDLCGGEAADIVQNILGFLTDQTLDKLVKEVMYHQDAFRGEIDERAIYETYGLDPRAEEIDALAIAFDGSEAALISQIAESAKRAGKSYEKIAQDLLKIDTNKVKLTDLEVLFDHFLYSNEKTSKSRNFPQERHTKAVDAFAPFIEELHDWMDRAAEAYQYILAVRAARQTSALFSFARAFIPAYDAKKTARGALDFDDLIRKTRVLLTEKSFAQWVLYKLDGGIDHILVDEAQDTSPMQWDVIRALTEEFATGQGAGAERERTIFVVGDKKQSIYSFQGADPTGFDRMKEHFGDVLGASGQTLADLQLQFSFRSSSAILSLVDRTFVRDRADGLEKDVFHRAFKNNMPGRIDLWPPIEPTKESEPDNWTDPVDLPAQGHHEIQLAQVIASQIKSMIGTPIPTEIKNSGAFAQRQISEGDIMVLVQRRNTLFSEIIRACKAEGLDVAGADRLLLANELAVKDLLSLLKFLALPEDSLALAEALRSPLFGWSEQELFSLAHGREKRAYLWQALRNSDANDHTLEILRDLRNHADFLRPYDLLARILVRHGGRQKLVARLGPEAEDAIDALLSKALSYERGHAPSLTGFLGWIEGDDAEVKRQIDGAGDRLRVMTVHGSKGLEAPIVILPDTAKRDSSVKNMLLSQNGSVIWKPYAKETPEVVSSFRAQAEADQERERRRLLYVAMTRAEKWLLVAAAGNVGTGSESWHQMVFDAMQEAAAEEFDAPTGTGLRIISGDWGLDNHRREMEDPPRAHNNHQCREQPQRFPAA